MKKGLRYDEMVDDALRGVIKRALNEAAIGGLSGDHHFYISFKTQMAGVSIPKYLYTKYPEEMTIVLQHQFWDLHASEEEFTVTLSFNGKPERLVIPLKAISHFADPSVKFALQFDARENEEILDKETSSLLFSDGQDGEDKPTSPKGNGAEIVALDQFRQKK